MKAEDVTLEIAERWQAQIRDAERVHGDREAVQVMISSAVNAVFGDPAPITAEWLVASGYLVSGLTFVSPHDDLLEVELVGCDDGFEVSYGQMIFTNTKTIGQLRALEIGLGLRGAE